MSFYIAIICFICSLVLALILMILGKNYTASRFYLACSFHGIFLFAFLASLLLGKQDQGTIVYNYFFMLYVCSGLILSGWSWRIPVALPIRIYFSFFILPFPLFLISPSMLVNFLLTMRYTDTLGPVHSLGARYYLETQHSHSSQQAASFYKLIRKKGMFKKMIERDINFGGNLDSVRVLDIQPEENLKLRAYISRVTLVSEDRDSVDRVFDLNKDRGKSIEYKVQ